MEQETHSIWHIKEGIPTISSHIFGDIGPFAVSNTTTTIMLIGLMFLVLSVLLWKPKERPSFFQGFAEYIYEAILSLVAQIVGDKERAARIVPYVGAILLFLAVSNLLPLFPFISAFYVGEGEEHIGLFRGTTTDFNTTFSLALAAVVILQFIGMKEQGVFGYLSHFIQIKQVIQGFRKGLSHGAIAIVSFFVGLIEIISEIAKTISLSLRLFGNMFAHEVLTVVLLGVFAFGLPSLWMGMGVLVGIVQSLVFAALVTVYYSLVLKKEDGH